MGATKKQPRPGTIIQHKKHYLTRFPIGLAIILFFSLSPFLIGLAGSWLSELMNGEPCHEANCGWAVLPWLTLLTLPAGAAILFAYLVIVILDTIKLTRQSSRRDADNV